QHSLGPVFLPCTSAGKKFRSCELRQKRCLRSSNRGSQARDTLCPLAEATPTFSYALNSKCVTASSPAARLHVLNLGIFEQLFNHDFRFTSVRNHGVDHVVICVVSAKHTTISKIRRISIIGAIPLTWFGMHEDRADLRIRMAGRN